MASVLHRSNKDCSQFTFISLFMARQSIMFALLADYMCSLGQLEKNDNVGGCCMSPALANRLTV